MSNPEPALSLENGKYTFFVNGDVLHCRLNDLPWRSFAGDKAVFALFNAACEKQSAPASHRLLNRLVSAIRHLQDAVGESHKVVRCFACEAANTWTAEAIKASEHLSLELNDYVLIPVETALPEYEEEVLTTDGTYFTVAERVATTKEGEVWKLCGEEGLDDPEDRTTVTVKKWCKLPKLEKAP